MRKGVLGSITALAAGAGLASAQGPVPYAGPPTGGPEMVLPAAGYGAPIPPYLGEGPGVIPVPDVAPNGAPIYPPPGVYGSNPYPPPVSTSTNLAPHWWVHTEYLLWWTKNQPTRVPYLTTGARAEGGLIGQPTTRVLVGDADIGYGLSSGFRISGGWFKGDDRRYGTEISGFLLEQQGVHYFAQSDANGVPVIARPFVDANTGANSVMTVAFPNLAAGSYLFKTTTQTWGAEGNQVLNLYRSSPDDPHQMSITGMLGFRYMDIHETLNISTASTLLGSNIASFAGLDVAAPATIMVQDNFETTNRFYGGQIGFRSEANHGRWQAQVVGKIAFGLMNQTVMVDGVSGVNDPSRGIVATNPGGLFADASTITTIRNDEFAFIPEVSANLGYNWCNWLTTYVGYNFMYVSRVLRPSEQLTDVINPTMVPVSPTFGQGTFAPTPNNLLTQSEFWIQGVNFGFMVKY